MTEVTLSQILQAREDRVRMQQQFLQNNPCPLLCFTMNIAGPIKNTPLIQRGFRLGLEALADQISEALIVKRYISSEITGNTALFSIQMNARELKKICTDIEDSVPLGRLFDMDVLDTNGNKLERSVQRGCLVCGAPGRTCAASRAHSVTELQHVTKRILTAHFAQLDIEQIADLAVNSLLDEVNTTPKPGLVDQNNNGSHKDMNLSHFVASAHALRDYFVKCVEIGQNTAHLLPHETFLKLRAAGLKAEEAMYQATGGVNTHKGIIYTMGILCGSIGRLWSAETPIVPTNAICEESAKMVIHSVKSDFASANGETAGERLYASHGLPGIRGEVASGLSSVTRVALPTYEKALAEGFSQNYAGVITLLHLIANVEDTNLYHRGGLEGAVWAKQAAKQLIGNGYPELIQIQYLDDAFIARNLSPGGCADLLAATYFLHKLQYIK